jgi:DNA-binding transcriptional MerR regulator
MGERRYLLADLSKKLDVPPYRLRYLEDALSISIPKNERGLRYYRKQELELFAAVLRLESKGFDIAEIKLIINDIHRVERLPSEKLLELRDRLDMCTGKENSHRTVETKTSLNFRKENNYNETKGSLAETPEITMDIRKENKSEISTEKSEPAMYMEKENKSGTSTGASEASTDIKKVNKRSEMLKKKGKKTAELEACATETEDKMAQFRSIMTEIMLDALRQNNEELGQRINYTVTDSVVREINYMMDKREESLEEHFKGMDRRLRELSTVKEP